MARWTLTNPFTSDSMTFQVNPNSGGSWRREREIHAKATTASGNNAAHIFFEGRDKPKTSEVSGVLLTQTMYDTLLDWYKKRVQLDLVDDLGRNMTIYITGFEPSRVRRLKHPWAHEYTLTFQEIFLAS